LPGKEAGAAISACRRGAAEAFRASFNILFLKQQLLDLSSSIFWFIVLNLFF
jgi:hypothetical protein